MPVTTRQELIDYCLRKKGSPVVEINIDPDQIEDRVDEAIEYYRLYHWDGIEKVYLKHENFLSFFDFQNNKNYI